MCESTRDMMASFFHLVPGITSFADGQRSDLNTGAATPGAPTKHVSAQAAVSASKNPIVPAPIGQFAPPGSPVKMASVIIVPIIMKPPYPPAPVRLVKLRKFHFVVARWVHGRLRLGIRLAHTHRSGDHKTAQRTQSQEKITPGSCVRFQVAGQQAANRLSEKFWRHHKYSIIILPFFNSVRLRGAFNDLRQMELRGTSQ